MKIHKYDTNTWVAESKAMQIAMQVYQTKENRSKTTF